MKIFAKVSVQILNNINERGREEYSHVLQGVASGRWANPSGTVLWGKSGTFLKISLFRKTELMNAEN